MARDRESLKGGGKPEEWVTNSPSTHPTCHPCKNSPTVGHTLTEALTGPIKGWTAGPRAQEHSVCVLPQPTSPSPKILVPRASLTQPLPIERRHPAALLQQVELPGAAPPPAPQELHNAPQCPCHPRSLARDSAAASRSLPRRGTEAETKPGGAGSRP